MLMSLISYHLSWRDTIGLEKPAQSLHRISSRGAPLMSQDTHLQQAWAGMAGGQEGIMELTSASAAHTAFQQSGLQMEGGRKVERQGLGPDGDQGPRNSCTLNESRKPSSCFKDRSRRVWGTLKVDTGGKGPGWPTQNRTPLT